MTEAEELRADVDRHQRALFGEEPGTPGLVASMRSLEEWSQMIDKERNTVKSLLVGVLIGLGLNGIGIITILTQLVK